MDSIAQLREKDVSPNKGGQQAAETKHEIRGTHSVTEDETIEKYAAQLTAPPNRCSSALFCQISL